MASKAKCLHRSIHKLSKKTLNGFHYRNFLSSTCLFKDHNRENTKETHFGFQSVPEDEKEGKVYEVFSNVAEKYDLMNDAMSVGIHRIWKDLFIRKLSPSQGINIIDVAGGTGDIAFRCLDFVNTRKGQKSYDEHNLDRSLEIKDKIIMDPARESMPFSDGDTSDSSDSDSDRDSESVIPSCHVTVCDINQSMLEVGKERARNSATYSGISWVKGNAECLPFDSNSFDAYTIAFGIRNCTHVDQVVKEAFRILKPGGRFMCLEFSHVSNPLIRSIYDEYSFQVIPVLGQILAADWQSYQYLVESIRQFPNQEDFKDIIKSSGFSAVTYENLTFGVVAIHSGFKF